MQEETEKISIREQFEQVLETGNRSSLQEFLDDQNIVDVADLFHENELLGTDIITSLSIHRAASMFKILELAEQKRIIKQLHPHKTAELLNELPPDDRTSFLSLLPSNVVRELVKTLDPEERKVTLSLLGYPEGSVGRLMTPDYIYVYEHDTVEDVLNTIRKYAKSTETIDVIYVINDKGELLDDIRIREFILAAPSKKVHEIMDGRYIALQVEDDQEMANEAFKMNNRVALPVVSKSNKLLGIVTIDDVLWVASEEFSEDMQKMGGLEALDEPYMDTPFVKLIRKRAGWLIVLFLGELLTATALAYFNDEIAKATVLVMFMPLIASSGGNSGSQASTLIIQAMAVGEVTLKDWWRVLHRELFSGLALGGILACIGFLRICIWHGFMAHGLITDLYGPHWMLIAFSVSIALVGVVLWGTVAGSMLPLILKKLGADPAVSSAPFVATLVDVTGIIIYFTVAYMFLKGILL